MYCLEKCHYLIYSIWICPQGSLGCQKVCHGPLNTPFEIWCANIAPKLKNIQNTLKNKGFFDISDIDDFLFARYKREFICQVSELQNMLLYSGDFEDELKEFLLNKGF